MTYWQSHVRLNHHYAPKLVWYLSSMNGIVIWVFLIVSTVHKHGEIEENIKQNREDMFCLFT